MKKKASIGQLFLLTFLFFLIVPLTVGFLFFIVTVFESNKDKVSQDLQVVSHALATKVNTRLESPAQYLRVIAETLNKQMDDDHITQLVTSGVEAFPIFDSIYILDEDKRIKKLSFGALSNYHKDDFEGIMLHDVKSFNDFSLYWSRPFVSLVTNNYIVRVSVKVPDGYVVGDLSLKFISETLIHARMKEYTNVFVVDTNGDVISSSDLSRSVVRENLFAHPAVIESFKGGHISFNYDWKGDSYAGSGFKIPISDWHLILEQKEDIAFKLFYDILFVTCISALVVGFFIIIVLYLIKKKLITPIELLTSRSELISQNKSLGFSDEDKSVFRELGTLYDAFENMSKKVNQRENELKQKEEYVRSIFDSTTNTGIIVISGGSESVINDANTGAQLLSGYKMSELIGLPPVALVKDVAGDIGRLQDEAMVRNSAVSGRFMMTKKNGISFPVLCTVHPLHDDLNVFDAFIVVFVDISELVRIQTALESEKERLDVTLKSIGEGVLATDKSGRITLINSSSENILGQKLRFLLGQDIKDTLQIYDFNSGDDITGELTSVEHTSRRTFKANIVSTHETGITTVTITASVMLNNKGDVVGFVYVFRDISESIRMDQELLERRQQLEEINSDLEMRVTEETAKRRKNEQMLFEQAKFAAMGQMISAIAHQWRQPLNALALYTQDIEDAFEAGEVNAKFLSIYVENSMKLINHMSATIDDFRNFFHSTNTKEKANLITVLTQSLALVGSQLKGQNVDFEFCVKTPKETDIFINDMPSEDSSYGEDVLIFPSEIKQVVLNILQNARDAISEKRIKELKQAGKIHIVVEYLSEKVVFSISNDGGNIPDDSLVSIFDPYYTTKPEGEGTGIGLYMSKIMVEEHMGGLLTAENIVGGAKFIVSLYYNNG